MPWREVLKALGPLVQLPLEKEGSEQRLGGRPGWSQEGRENSNSHCKVK
jgi:hypothetical protein